MIDHEWMQAVSGGLSLNVLEIIGIPFNLSNKPGRCVGGHNHPGSGDIISLDTYGNPASDATDFADASARVFRVHKPLWRDQDQTDGQEMESVTEGHTFWLSPPW